MRTILLAGLALCAASLASVAPAHAQVSIRGPGVNIETGPNAYWRDRHEEAEWRRRSEWREAQHNRVEWLRDHCVRDWSGHEYCR